MRSHAFNFRVNLQVKALESFERGTAHPGGPHLNKYIYIYIYVAVQSPLK